MSVSTWMSSTSGTSGERLPESGDRGGRRAAPIDPTQTAYTIDLSFSPGWCGASSASRSTMSRVIGPTGRTPVRPPGTCWACRTGPNPCRIVRYRPRHPGDDAHHRIRSGLPAGGQRLPPRHRSGQQPRIAHRELDGSWLRSDPRVFGRSGEMAAGSRWDSEFVAAPARARCWWVARGGSTRPVPPRAGGLDPSGVPLRPRLSGRGRRQRRGIAVR